MKGQNTMSENKEQAVTRETQEHTLLEVTDLHTSFFTDAGEVKAVDGVSFRLDRGKVLGIVGESGSGKSVLTKTFMGLLDANGWVDSGSILYQGHDLAQYKTEKEWLTIRGREIAMVL